MVPTSPGLELLCEVKSRHKQVVIIYTALFRDVDIWVGQTFPFQQPGIWLSHESLKTYVGNM